MSIYTATGKKNLKKLNTIQNNALRIATGAFKSTPIHSLEAEARVTSMDTKIKLEASKTYIKNCSKHHQNPVAKLNLQKMIQGGGERKKDSIARAKESLEEIHEPFPPIVSTPPISPIPLYFNIKDYICEEFGGSSRKDMTEREARRTMEEFREEKYKDFYTIYTDGSRENVNLKSSSGLCAPEDKIAKIWKDWFNNSSLEV